MDRSFWDVTHSADNIYDIVREGVKQAGCCLTPKNRSCVQKELSQPFESIEVPLEFRAWNQLVGILDI
jgi:hypothetical protein